MKNAWLVIIGFCTKNSKTLLFLEFGRAGNPKSQTDRSFMLFFFHSVMEGALVIWEYCSSYFTGRMAERNENILIEELILRNSNFHTLPENWKIWNVLVQNSAKPCSTEKKPEIGFSEKPLPKTFFQAQARIFELLSNLIRRIYLWKHFCPIFMDFMMQFFVVI